MENKTVTVPLKNGLIALVDESDYHLVSPFVWSVTCNDSRNYAVRYEYFGGKTYRVFMHRVVNKTPDKMMTDHINGDGLDNRRSNLRTATHSQNMQNRRKHKNNASGYKGVYLEKESGRYRAQITSGGKIHRLGRFASPEEAYQAYLAAAKSMHGEFFRAE
jgi:hypothetical protein